MFSTPNVRQLFGGTGSTKKTRTVAPSGSDGSSGSQTASAAGGTSSPGSSGLPLNAQSGRSFAAAAGGGSAKRGTPALPAFPRPQLRRGKAVIEHEQYASMERPAPATAAPNVLYVDMRASSLSPQAVLALAYPVVKDQVVGFQLFAAQKTLGLVFASAEARILYLGKSLGDSGLCMYPASPSPTNLLKLTLQGVPFWAEDAIKKELPKILEPYGKLVFLALMVTDAEGWYSDQWHATIARPEGSTSLPPETITLVGETVIVDVPGQRRYCRHCEASTHVKSSCRQGQREKSRQNQQARDAAAAKALLQQHHQQTLDQPPPQDQQQPVDNQHQDQHQQPHPTHQYHPTDYQTQILLRAAQKSAATSQPSAFDDTMDTDSGEVSYTAQLERAHAVLSAESAHPNSQDPTLVAAAKDFIREAARSGSGES